MSKRIEIAGVPFDPVTEEDAMTAIEVFMKGEYLRHIVTPNPEMVLEAGSNPAFKKILRKADLSLPDGTGILWAAHYLSLRKPRSFFARRGQFLASLFSIVFSPARLKKPLPARVTGTDMLYRITEASQEHKWRIFLLGAAPGVAQKAMDRLLEKYPRAIFAGAYSGEPAPTRESNILSILKAAHPDLLFVAYGHPAQEEWIARNARKLGTVKVAIGVGGAFDFAAGVTKRAPRLMQRMGLEWLWRLMREPRRLKRIWKATVVFTGKIARLSV